MRRTLHSGLVWILWLVALGLSLREFAPTDLSAAGRPPLTSFLMQAVRRPSGYVNARVLAAGVAETETAPSLTGASGARLVAIFRSDCASFYVHPSPTAASEPSADVADGTASEGSPTAFNLGEGDTYSVLSPTACRLTIAYYPEH